MIKVSSWIDFRKEVLISINKVLEDSNCSQFKILGYKYLDIKLFLIYDDCIEVLIYQYNEENECIDVKRFYTKDFEGDEKLQQVGEFQKEFTAENYGPEDETKIKTYQL